MVLIENYLNIPKECRVNNVIAKESFPNLKNNDKKILTNNVKQIRWVYAIKQDNTAIKPSKNYCEVEVINVKLKQDKKIEKIAEIILKSIPYPTLLVYEHEEKIKLAASHISEYNERILLDDLRFTNWINLEKQNKFTKELFENLKIENLNSSNFEKFYQDIINTIIRYNASLTAEKSLNRDINEIKLINDEIQELDKEIEIERRKINKENQLNRKIEIINQLEELKTKRKELKEKLR